MKFSGLIRLMAVLFIVSSCQKTDEINIIGYYVGERVIHVPSVNLTQVMPAYKTIKHHDNNLVINCPESDYQVNAIFDNGTWKYTYQSMNQTTIHKTSCGNVQAIYLGEGKVFGDSLIEGGQLIYILNGNEHKGLWAAKFKKQL